MPNPPGRSQSGRQTLHPPSAIGQYAPTAPRVRSRPHTGIFDRAIGRHVCPMGPARSSSASEYRQTWGGHVEHAHGDDPLLSGTPVWYAVKNHPYWPGPLTPPFSLELTAFMNTLVIPNQPHASTSRLRPGRNISGLVSLAEIATRFRIDQGTIQTLNAAVEKPDVLRFIVLFNDYENGNRGCYRKLAVCAKANLHLLPGHELPYPDQDAGEPENEHNGLRNAFSDSDLIDLRGRAVAAVSEKAEVADSSSVMLTPPTSTKFGEPRLVGNATKASDPQPIAVYSKVRSSRQLQEFMFLGWYELEETEFFAPRSSALVKMLEQRSGRALKEDLENEWAKIDLGGLFLAIVALFLPPISVLKRTGCDHHLFVNIVLTLFGWTPGILHAWYIILRFPDGRRAAELRDDRHGPAEIYVQYPDGRFYKYKELGCWSKGECPGQPVQRIVVLQQQDPLKPHLLQQFQYHPKFEPKQNSVFDPDVNDEDSQAAEEPLRTLYIEETGPEPEEATLDTRLPEPMPDGEPTSDEEWVIDGEVVSVEEPSRLSYSSTSHIREKARAW
ncbi:hypothetical protein KCU91_g1778, partial [Aureobasidium melanogenum]